MQAGVALLLGGMLIAAGLPKTVTPWHVASALRRVIRLGHDRSLLVAGRLLGCWELALGTALVLAGGRFALAAAALAVLTFTGFAGFVVLAIRRGSACGCWASLSEGPAGGAELGRAVFLAALALDLLDARAAGSASAAPVAGLGWRSLAWAAGLLAGTYLVARLGGFAHAGTRAASRRYLASLAAAPAATPVTPATPAIPATSAARPAATGFGEDVTSSPNVRRSRQALPPRPPAGTPAALETAPEGSAR